MKYNVNIDLANETKKEMQSFVNSNDSRVLNGLGAFASLFDLNLENYKHPVLVLKTEEPGSKQLIAMQYDRVEGVCVDMINHLVNDCIVMGATPLTVQDAIICGKIDKNIVTRIVKAVSEACTNNECILTGGETSEQPKVIADGTYILTSSIVGVVEKEHIVDGHDIKKGDVVIGLASNGVHTNGYTLVRTIMESKPEILSESVDGVSFIDAALKPHTAYYGALKGMFGKNILKGMAHITGGGICENLNRILPTGTKATINLDSYTIPGIFKTLKKFGQLDDALMLRTFNMGVGLAVVTDKQNVSAVLEHIVGSGIDAWVIGEICDGEKEVVCTGEFKW